MSAALHRLSLPGPMLRRGFWLYVWRVDTGAQTLLYVGRTGDNSSPHATAPYTRMGQHLGKMPNQNALRRHLESKGITPEDCARFDLVAHGPIYDQVPHDTDDRTVLMQRHIPLRDQVGAMEKLLCDGLKAAGYNVMNSVNCRWTLDAEGLEKWQAAIAAFQSEFPDFGKVM
ncbi:hypothetical protein ACTTAK_13905 [Rhodobacter capsulatus]|uniref:hypothetical protein n=1 Tax=Rhodobacter capsulatus TaxID=1061 RepID=UPI0011445B91|nr:hypothetical protein [Rhodobacter capsulatus]TQD35586.1 hypothetical protein FKW81_08125 [Rhodobacter capsulatus]